MQQVSLTDDKQMLLANFLIHCLNLSRQVKAAPQKTALRMLNFGAMLMVILRDFKDF